MIRRAISTAGGARWLLIPQPQHAKIAGLLADHFRSLPPDVADAKQELLGAIHRHDDGWDQWERAPRVDAARGRPLDFTEMPTATGLDIWTKSIDGVEALGPLAAWVVSGHFCSLLKNSAARGTADVADQRQVSQFLSSQQVKQDEWLADWRDSDPARHTVDVAAACLEILRAFDGLSLWFCCRERTSPLSFRPCSALKPVEFRPLSADRVEVSPWPFSVPTLAIEATGWSLPVYSYRDGAAVAQAWQPAHIGWFLQPATDR